MSGIKPEKWSTDNPFVDQAPEQTWSADNPFTDQTAPVETAVASKPTDEGGHPILSGIGQAVKEAAIGTGQFFVDVARPLDRPPIVNKLLGRPEPAATEHPSGLELAKGAVLAPFEMIAGGGKEAFDPESTTKQRAHGSATAVLGALGLLGGAHAIGKFRKALKAKPELVAPPSPAAGTPPTAVVPGPTPSSFAEARTPEERQAVVERLAKQGEATEAAQKLKKGNFIKTVLTWNTLSAEQRGVIVKGLAVTDYTKTWKELGRDARATITKALGLDSGTNLDTSPTVTPGGPGSSTPTVPEQIRRLNNQIETIKGSKEVDPANGDAYDYQIKRAQEEIDKLSGSSGPSAPPIPPTTGLPQETVSSAPSVRPTSKAATERIIKDIESEKLDLSHYTDADIEAAYHLLDNPHSSYGEHTKGPTELMDNPLTDAHSRAYRAALDALVAQRGPYKPPQVPPLTPEELAVPTGELKPGEAAAKAMGKTPDEVLKAIDPNSQAPGRATTPEQRESAAKIVNDQSLAENHPTAQSWYDNLPAEYQKSSVATGDFTGKAVDKFTDLTSEQQARVESIWQRNKEHAKTADNAVKSIGKIKSVLERQIQEAQPPIPPQIKALSDDALRGAIEVYRDRAKNASDSADIADNTQLADMLQREADSRTPTPSTKSNVNPATGQPDLTLDETIAEHAKNRPSLKDAPWSGFVDLRDGVVESRFTKDEAQKTDYHHSLLLSPDHLERMRSGEGTYFWIDKDGRPMTMEGPLKPDIAKRVLEQMKDAEPDAHRDRATRPATGDAGTGATEPPTAPVVEDLAREAPKEPEAPSGEAAPLSGQRLLDRVVAIKSWLRIADARERGRSKRNGLWAEKSPEYIQKSIDRDKEKRAAFEKELEELLPKLDEDQRTQLADRAETSTLVNKHVDDLMKQLPPEPTPQDQLTLMREGVEPLDPDRLQKIEQSIQDQGAVDKLINEPSKVNADALKDATLDELDNLLDEADAALEAGQITPEQHAKGLFEIADAKRNLKAKGQQPTPIQPTTKFKMPDTVGKDLNKFSNDQLTMAKKSIGALLRSPDIDSLPEANILRQELDRIFDYEAQIRKASEGGAGPTLSIKKIDVSGAPKFEQYFSKKIVLEPDLKSPWNFVKFMRQMYQGFVRPSHALNVTDRLYEGATGQDLQSHKMAGKLMEMADGSMTQAETFLRGDGPFVPGPNGELIKTGAKSLADIVVNTAKGDVERLGWLWAARRALELKALRNKSIGIDLGYAQELAVNSSRELHTAVDEARAYHSSLSLFSQIRGLISPEARTAFEQETSYGPIQRLFGPKEVVSKVAQTINKTGRTAETIMASDEFKRLKGSDLLIRNMVESSIDVTHRILRAAKINEIANALYDQVEAQPDLFRGMVDKFEHREHLQIMRDITARASAVKAMFKESGIDISPEHAHLFANLLSDNALDVQGGKLLVWRGGEIKALKVDELIANSLKSLTPSEQALWIRAMGKPARLARIGIVMDPLFMVGQILNDQFQGWFNTRYGFMPVLDTFKGWWNIVHNTEAFKEAQRAGGIEKSALRGKTTLGDILAGPNLTPGELAFNQIKTMHPIKALQSVVTPLREATRMGEYLQARGHGATPIEAAWAARDLLGNYSMQGTFSLIRALNHMSLFLGPAIAVTDKTFRTIRERPGQWFTRATTLAGISALIYMANDGDEEIEQLRQTPGGQRWWFMRVGDQIVKVRKPYLEGAVFASGMEAFLDMKKGENPEAFKLWLQAQRQELALNMLPVMGVVPFQLWANKDTYSGAPIIPEGQQGLDPQFQTGYYSGSAERIVGKETGIPPAILSYVVRGTTGYLGESAVKGVSAAIDWANTGELPPVEDLPLTQRAFAKYPAYSVKPVQDFYKLAEEVDRAAKTINYAAQHSPDDIEDVLLAHEAQLPMIELFNDSREQIADLRRAITSVEDLKDLGPASKKLYTDEYLRSIIEIAGATVQVARAMQDQGVQ